MNLEVAGEERLFPVLLGAAQRSAGAPILGRRRRRETVQPATSPRPGLPAHARDSAGARHHADALEACCPWFPPEAGLYKASTISSRPTRQPLIVEKLIGRRPQRSRDWRDAPTPSRPTTRAGGEGDLETRIDEQPLPADAGLAGSEAAVRAARQGRRAQRCYWCKRVRPLPERSFRCRSVIVSAGRTDWDRDAVRTALDRRRRKVVDHLATGRGMDRGDIGAARRGTPDGLGTLMFANRGRLLFLEQRRATARPRCSIGPDAGRRRPALDVCRRLPACARAPNYERVMTALDFTGSAGRARTGLLSGNIASLSRVNQLRNKDKY